MLIPEAVQLVMHAAALARGGEMFVLDMGEQMKVLDMARTLIRLSGFVPEQDIPITFTGLRPGEKLYEELVGDQESVEPSGVEKITRIRRDPPLEPEALQGRLAELKQYSNGANLDGLLRVLQELVPTYTPSNPSPDGGRVLRPGDHPS
jgi:FlaA1/EpsC-like NDP-sugar epimerase